MAVGSVMQRNPLKYWRAFIRAQTQQALRKTRARRKDIYRIKGAATDLRATINRANPPMYGRGVNHLA